MDSFEELLKTVDTSKESYDNSLMVKKLKKLIGDDTNGSITESE